MTTEQIFTIKKRLSWWRVAVAGLLIFISSGGGGGDLLAQYQGAPVKKDRLLRALRSKQLQSADIVTIINRNGVDFQLSAEARNALVAAGARPEVIQAVAQNLRKGALPRTPPVETFTARNDGKNNRRSTNYEDLLERAMYVYREGRNPQSAARILQTAARTKPQNPAAYQMLGFVNLYGLSNPAQAEKSMRESFANGGSAVFRVYHDDNGKFSHRCTGSLYISRGTLRFESDDNVHTFETTTANINKIKLDTVSTGDWKKRSTFKVTFKFGKEEAKFRFAPVSGNAQESKMVERFISAANPAKIPPPPADSSVIY